MKLVLIGGGGHCRSVMDSALKSGKYQSIVVTDIDETNYDGILSNRIVGDDDNLTKLYNEGFEAACITVGSIKSTELRQKLSKKAQVIGFGFENIIDTSAVVSDYSFLGKGVFIGKNAVVNSDVRIDDHAIINTAAIIEHECRIGAFTHVAVGAVICGGCDIGNDVFIGANATVIQGVKIGMNSIIGAGSLILADVPENMTVVGVWGVLDKK